MAEQGNLSKLRQLLDRRALPSVKNTRGQCLLHITVLHGYVALVRYIIKAYPAMVHAKDNVSLDSLSGDKRLVLQLSFQQVS